MSARSLGWDSDPTIVADIDRHLRSVCEENHTRVLLAVESGSRAWGFPSPDSDYDCRFIFARRPDDYLSLYPQRDVIEFTLDGQLDVNGWELGKALRLLLKGNAVVIEWLSSPLIYAGDLRFRDEALEFARDRLRTSRPSRGIISISASARDALILPTTGQCRPKSSLYLCVRPWLCAGCVFILELRLLRCIFRRSRPKVICHGRSRQWSMNCSGARLCHTNSASVLCRKSLAPSSTLNFCGRVNFGLMGLAGAILKYAKRRAGFSGDGLTGAVDDRAAARCTPMLAETKAL